MNDEKKSLTVLTIIIKIDLINKLYSEYDLFVTVFN